MRYLVTGKYYSGAEYFDANTTLKGLFITLGDIAKYDHIYHLTRRQDRDTEGTIDSTTIIITTEQ